MKPRERRIDRDLYVRGAGSTGGWFLALVVQHVEFRVLKNVQHNDNAALDVGS